MKHSRLVLSKLPYISHHPPPDRRKIKQMTELQCSAENPANHHYRHIAILSHQHRCPVSYKEYYAKMFALQIIFVVVHHKHHL